MFWVCPAGRGRPQNTLPCALDKMEEVAGEREENNGMVFSDNTLSLLLLLLFLCFCFLQRFLNGKIQYVVKNYIHRK